MLTGDDIERALRRISHEILEHHRGSRGVVLVGVPTRGVHLARRLAANLEKFDGSIIPVGVIDIGPYRDDERRRPASSDSPTDIPVELAGSKVILVDDVLYTGRTARAALDALSDIGRADSVELAVLVDRGHRELPIRADYVGRNIPTSDAERVNVRVAGFDDEPGVWIVNGDSA